MMLLHEAKYNVFVPHSKRSDATATSQGHPLGRQSSLEKCCMPVEDDSEELLLLQCGEPLVPE
eukprot:5984162-Pleurochrysis_carterae.AAC.1